MEVLPGPGSQGVGFGIEAPRRQVTATDRNAAASEFMPGHRVDVERSAGVEELSGVGGRRFDPAHRQGHIRFPHEGRVAARGEPVSAHGSAEETWKLRHMQGA
ncbi:hypothetical protein BJF85_09715 [Saccharomonospora sp. CUA-673]|nr:hypothetical protein BJF85_09715 [Saccharomonospora sp. CUA-673]